MIRLKALQYVNVALYVQLYTGELKRNDVIFSFTVLSNTSSSLSLHVTHMSLC